MMVKRSPVFELHILPMFRLIDIDHMRFQNWELTDYKVVSSSAQDILQELKSSSPMPTESTGGPWPKEWIDLFERWIDEGKRRLSLNSGQNYLLDERSGLFELTCQANLPYFGAKTWLDPVHISADVRHYRLVLEELIPAPAPNPFQFPLKERFRSDVAAIEVSVADANGDHHVGLVTS